MMNETEELLKIARFIQWERVKGELRAFASIFFVIDGMSGYDISKSSFIEINEKIEKFIEEFDDYIN